MIYGVTDADRFLYHYTSAETAAGYVFRDRSLKLGSFLCMNDPKENKDFRFWTAAARHDRLLDSGVEGLPSKFSRALKAMTRVACFCTDSRPLTGETLRDISSRGFAKPRMWAEYGKKHTGVCLVFDSKRLAEQIMAGAPGCEAVCGGKVNYTNRLFGNSMEDRHYCIDVEHLDRVGFDSAVGLHARQFRHRLFFEKMTDWRDEQEFRWVVLSRAEGDLHIDYSDSLVGVMIGERTSDVETILRLLPLNVEVIKLGWINGCPWYDFSEVRCQRDIRQMRGLFS